jgi:hypothetical protein
MALSQWEWAEERSYLTLLPRKGYNQRIKIAWCEREGAGVKTNILAAILGLGFTATGVLAFFFPEVFFNLLPSYYGTFNYHFVKDAGIAFFSSGTLLLLSLKFVQWQAPLTLGGALFVGLHGLFHIQMLVAGMASRPVDIATEVFVIISPAVLTVFLLVLRLKQDNPSIRE